MTRKSTTIGIKLAIVALLCTAFFTAKFGNSLRVSASPEDGAPKLNYSSYNDLEDMVSDYHKKMNEIVNEKTELFLSYDHKALQKFDRPPQEIMKKVQNEDGTSKLVPTGNFEACDSKNTSTFCLAELLVREHFAFREGMIARRNIVLSEAQANALEEIGKLDKKYSSAANKKSGEDELEDLQDIEEDEQETISGLVERVGKIDTFIESSTSAVKHSTARLPHTTNCTPHGRSIKNTRNSLQIWRTTATPYRM